MADLKILIPARFHEDTVYHLEFFPKGSFVSTYSFECDKDGNVYTSKMCEGGLKNLAMLLESDEYESIVKKYTHEYKDYEVVSCECGKVFSLWKFSYGSTIRCPKCGKLYNLFGQELEHA